MNSSTFSPPTGSGTGSNTGSGPGSGGMTGGFGGGNMNGGNMGSGSSGNGSTGGSSAGNINTTDSRTDNQLYLTITLRRQLTKQTGLFLSANGGKYLSVAGGQTFYNLFAGINWYTK